MKKLNTQYRSRGFDVNAKIGISSKSIYIRKQRLFKLENFIEKHNKNPEDPTIIYYIIKTCILLQKYKEAEFWLKKVFAKKKDEGLTYSLLEEGSLLQARCLMLKFDYFFELGFWEEAYGMIKRLRAHRYEYYFFYPPRKKMQLVLDKYEKAGSF